MIEPKEYLGGVNGVPQFNDRKEMWETLKVTRVESHSPSVVEYINSLKKYYVNGSVKYECFSLGESEVLDWYCSRNQLKELLFFWKVWELPEISNTLKINEIDEDSNKAFEWSSPFILGGSLAWVLHNGGAYEKPTWSGSESKNLGDQAASDLIENDYENTLVFDSGKAWCSFFYDVAWDSTWVVLNKEKRLLHIIMATDTD